MMCQFKSWFKKYIQLELLCTYLVIINNNVFHNVILNLSLIMQEKLTVKKLDSLWIMTNQVNTN